MKPTNEPRLPSFLESGYPFRTTPYAHQQRIFMASRDDRNAAYFMEMRTGKTKLTLDVASWLWARNEIDAVLVIAPNGVHATWPAQVEEHVPREVPTSVAIYRSTMQPLRRLELMLMRTPESLRIVAMNCEALAHKSGYDAAACFLEGQRVLLVVDESHKFKTPRASRTKALWKLADLAAYRRILTGTELTQGYQDLYAQYRILDRDLTGCRTYTEFKQEYCLLGGFENRQIVGYRNTDKLLAKVARSTWSVSLSDCEDMPTHAWVEVPVEMSVEQRTAYNQLVRDYTVQLDSGNSYEIDLGLTRLGKLLEIISGFIRPAEGGVQLYPCPRLGLTVELVEQARGKVLIWTAFQMDVIRLRETLDKALIKSATYYGGISDEECQEELSRWRKDPSCKVLILSLSKGAEGLMLAEASTAIYYSRNFKYDHRMQSAKRNILWGNTAPRTYYDLVAPHTIDTRVLKALSQKGGIAAEVRSADVFRAWLNDPDHHRVDK